jgi:hypothetical protein
MSIAIKNSSILNDPETKDRHKQKLKEAWADPKFHEKMKQKRIETAATPEFKS